MDVYAGSVGFYDPGSSQIAQSINSSIDSHRKKNYPQFYLFIKYNHSKAEQPSLKKNYCSTVIGFRHIKPNISIDLQD